MDEREIGVSLTTPTKLEEFQQKLYAKAKAEPGYRFYQLYDKLYRWDVLVEALRRAKANRGAAGVDGQTFEQVKEYGEEQWLKELQRELQDKKYRPQAVRRVLIPKPGGGHVDGSEDPTKNDVRVEGVLFAGKTTPPAASSDRGRGARGEGRERSLSALARLLPG